MIVVGAINVDLVVVTPRLPGPGETVVGGGLQTYGGGKGANAAVAAARAGASVRLIGAVGADDTGAAALAELAAEGIDISDVAVLTGGVDGSRADRRRPARREPDRGRKRSQRRRHRGSRQAEPVGCAADGWLCAGEHRDPCGRSESSGGGRDRGRSRVHPQSGSGATDRRRTVAPRTRSSRPTKPSCAICSRCWGRERASRPPMVPLGSRLAVIHSSS